MGCILFELTTRNKAFESDWAVFEYCSSQKNIDAISNNSFDAHSIEIITKHIVNMLQINPSDRPSASVLSTEFSYECQVIQVSHFNVRTVSSSIMVSAISDDTEQTQSMVQNRQVIISDSDNFTPILPSNLKGVSLHSAAAKGDIEAVKFLVKKGGADVESKDFWQKTPLSQAAKNGHLAIAKFLVEQGRADVKSKDQLGQTPLSCAVDHGHLEVVEFLVKEGGADAEWKDSGGQTLLSRAAQNGHLDIAKFLVEEGRADIELKDQWGKTPLSDAAARGHLDIVEFLVKEGGADVAAKDDRGLTPLSRAAINGRHDIVKFLVEEGGADVENGKTALDLARENAAKGCSWSEEGCKAVAAWLEEREKQGGGA